VRGPACDAWGWATIRLFTDALVLTKDLAPGSRLEGALALKRVEYHRGAAPLRSVAAEANAARGLTAGSMLTSDMVRFGPPAGTPVTVRVVAGGLSLEQQGTVIACRGNQVCASLPSGKRVEGQIVAGALLVGASP
jgi:flagella basal body P-ring formation protein FlgA